MRLQFFFFFFFFFVFAYYKSHIQIIRSTPSKKKMRELIYLLSAIHCVLYHPLRFVDYILPIH